LWLWNRGRARDFGGPWDAWDTLALAWIASGFVSAAFAGLHHREWISAVDILRYAAILWLLKRSRYDEAALRVLLAGIVLGTLAALAWGYYGLRITGERSTLGLKSVGHVNHSAIYLAITFGIVLMWVRAKWNSDRAVGRALGLTFILAFGLSLIVMESRAAVGAAFVVALCLLGVHSVRSGQKAWVVLLGAIAIGGALLAANPSVVRKNTHLLNESIFLAYRDAVWRTGLKAWREFPVFGVGMGNYSQIDVERIEEWSRNRGEPFDRASLRTQSHAHSLYVNTLVERGVAGFAVLLAVLGAWGWALVRHIPAAGDAPVRWTYWGGASAAWLVAIVVGTVNTTLHHEHALVSMLLLGGWLCMCRGRQPPAAIPA
jgi:O-antigen ligase